MICDHVTVTVTYDVIITSNSKSKIGKINENKSSLLFLALTYLIVNFIKKLPLVVGNDAILVVCNKLFKIAYFVVTTKETFIKRLVRLFKDNI